MNDIFTRVFLSFWLAIVLIAAGAGALVAVDFGANPDKPSAVTQEAAEVLERDGADGLRAWLGKRNEVNRQQRTLIVDSRGNELLGQSLPQPRRPEPPQGRPPPEPGPFEGFREFRPPPGSEIHASDGSVYRVLFDPPPRKSALSPPFSWTVRIGLVALALLVSGCLSYLFARSLSRPLQTLQAAARGLSSGNLAARAGGTVTKREDEIGVFAREFDSMAERLAALIAARQRLLQDVSHELRSPLARLQMAVDLARQDPTTTPNQLERIAKEAGRLERLVASILEYARLDRDPAARVMQPVDLTNLLQQIVDDAHFATGSQPGRIRLSTPGDVLVQGNAEVLHAAIDNVVRNALTHGGERSGVEIALGADEREVRITVRDFGPGVRESELERIFEPFYHLSADGTGIGLAITARGIDLHGGRVTAGSAEGGGLSVTLVLRR